MTKERGRGKEKKEGGRGGELAPVAQGDRRRW